MRFATWTALGALLAVASLALAEHEDTSQNTRCGWTTQGGNTSTGNVGGTGVYAYAGPNGSETGSSNGTAAAGVCTDGMLPVHGVAEAKVGGSCTYVVADGDPHNPGDADGFAKLAYGGGADCTTGSGGTGSHHA